MFKVKIKGLAGLKAEFANIDKKIITIVSQELEAMVAEWRAGAVRDVPVDEGSLKRSISYYMRGPLRAEIVAQSLYAPFMEFGTKGKYRPIPGTEEIAAQFKGFKGGDFMELLRNIVRWVRRKGITGAYSVKTRRRTGNKVNQFAEDYAAAWPIAMSILKKGVTPHPFFFKQAEIVWPAMIRRIEQRMAKELKVNVILPGGIKRPRITTI